jgi:hypothetical protein
MRIPFVSLAAAGALTLGGCAYGDLGYGVGYGGGYGYGAYNSPYYGYADPYYGGYGAPYYGWYNDYYYPGTGYYVYDTYRRPHMWNSQQRSYWTSRQTATSRAKAANWSGFDRRSEVRQHRVRD